MQTQEKAQILGNLNHGARESADDQEIAAALKEVEARMDELDQAIHDTSTEVRQVRQRAEADLVRTKKFAIADFAKSLLPFKDALEAAYIVETDDISALKQGLELSLKQLVTALEKTGRSG